MQDRAKSDDDYLPVVWKNPFSQHWLSFPNVSCSKENIGRVSHFCLKHQLLKS